MKGWSRRWWGWLAAVVLAVLAIQWGDSADAPPARDAVDLAPAQPPRGASPAGTPAPVVTEIRLDRLRREPYPPLKSDPFRGDQLVLVAVPRAGFEPGAALGEKVAAHVAARLGSTMRPSRVVWVEALPVTRSGKILRGVIRRVLRGEDPGDLASVANAEAISELHARCGRSPSSS